MTAAISILIILCCLVLVLAVLIQNPKGGGLASGFQSGSQVMGVRRTADFLEKATWTLAVLLFVFSIAATSYSKSGVAANEQGQTSTTKDKAADFDKKGGANTNPLNLGGTPPAPAPGGAAPAAPAKPGQ